MKRLHRGAELGRWPPASTLEDMTHPADLRSSSSLLPRLLEEVKGGEAEAPGFSYSRGGTCSLLTPSALAQTLERERREKGEMCEDTTLLFR